MLYIFVKQVLKRITQKEHIEILANKFKLWLNELSHSLKPDSYDEIIFDDLKAADILSSDLPIWAAAQKAVPRYEGILSEVGPRERLLRKFLAWGGLVPSTPEQAFDLQSNSTSYDSHLRFGPGWKLSHYTSDLWFLMWFLFEMCMLISMWLEVGMIPIKDFALLSSSN